MLEFKYDTQLLIEGENLDEDEINALGIGFVKADIINEEDVIRHDPDKLCNAVMQLVLQVQSQLG